MSATESALAQLRKRPEDAAAARDYNFALCRVFSVIRSAQLDAWSQPLTVPGYVVTHRKATREVWNPVDYEFTPCDELVIGGAAFHERARRGGLGATLLATRRTALKDFQKQFYRSPHLYYDVTAVATFEGNRCEIAFQDPLEQKNVVVAGRNVPLAGDFSTAVATFLVRAKPEKLGLTRLLHPDSYKDTVLLYRLQPYHPDKIPVLFVHGLQDTSATWMPMFNSLLDDPEIRDAYQFWFFTYPTGYPFPYSAALLRHDLDLFDKAFPDHKPIVIVGHSMGGLLTRMMLTDSGKDEMWRYLLNSSPAETPQERVHLAVSSHVRLRDQESRLHGRAAIGETPGKRNMEIESEAQIDHIRRQRVAKAIESFPRFRLQVAQNSDDSGYGRLVDHTARPPDKKAVFLSILNIGGQSHSSECDLVKSRGSTI